MSRDTAPLFCLRIGAGSGFSFDDIETAKPIEKNGVALFQVICEYAPKILYQTCGRGLGVTVFIHELLNKVALIYIHPFRSFLSITDRRPNAAHQF